MKIAGIAEIAVIGKAKSGLLTAKADSSPKAGRNEKSAQAGEPVPHERRLGGNRVSPLDLGMEREGGLR